MNKIEEMIEAIEEYIENCKPVPLSSNKIIVEKDAIEIGRASCRERV